MIQMLTILLLTIVSYSKTLVQVPVAHGDTVSGYLLVPERSSELGRPNGCEGTGWPAIVAMHDHGAWFTIGKEKLTLPMDTARLAEAQRWVEKFYEGQFVADTLASRGYVVLVIDALYWGERQPLSSSASGVPFPPQGARGDLDTLKLLNKQLKNEQPEFYGKYLEETGEVWFEWILADDKACVDYLMALPYVDKERIGVWGFSMGAYRAWQLAAGDERVAFCAAANWLTTLKKAETGVSGWSMLRPKMAGVEYGEIVSRISPRPILIQLGKEDPWFGPDAALPAIDIAQKKNHNDNLTVQVLDGAHRFTRIHLQQLLEWLRNL